MPIYDQPNQNVTLQPWMTGGGVPDQPPTVGGLPNSRTNTNYQGGIAGRWGAEAAMNPGAAQAQLQGQNNAAANSATLRNSPGYQALQWQQQQYNNGKGWGRSATDYNSLMNGLNSLNPGDINIDSTASMFTNAALSQYGQNSANQLDYLKQAGQAGIQGYQGIQNTLQNGVTDYLKNINQGAQQENAGINGTLGYYQSLANRNQLPGQGIMEQNIQGNTANALNQVRQFGGNSQGALGAITSLYGQQQQGMRDIGLNAANYQAQNQQNLAGYMGTVGGQRAAISNRVGEAAMTGAQTNAQGQQMLTQAQQSAANNTSDYYGNQATQGSSFLQSLMQQRLAAEQQQADLSRRSILDVEQSMGAGLNAATDASNQSYLNNVLMPQQNQQSYLYSLMGFDPSGSQNLLNSSISANANAQNSSYQQQMLRLQQMGQIGQSVGNMVGSWTNGQYGGAYG